MVFLSCSMASVVAPQPVSTLLMTMFSGSSSIQSDRYFIPFVGLSIIDYDLNVYKRISYLGIGFYDDYLVILLDINTSNSKNPKTLEVDFMRRLV